MKNQKKNLNKVILYALETFTIVRNEFQKKKNSSLLIQSVIETKREAN